MKKILFFLFITIYFQAFPQKVFEETFDDNRHHWVLEKGSHHESKIENGIFRMEIQGLGAIGKMVSGIDIPALNPNHDFLIQCSAICLDGDNFSGFGIAYDIKDNNNYQEFIITQKSAYGNFKMVSSWKKSLNSKNLTPSTLIKARSLNTLGIKKVGAQIQFYLNGNIINEISYTAFEHRKIGFVVYGKETISFDNLIVRQGEDLKTPAQEIASYAPSLTSTKEETLKSGEIRSINGLDHEKAQHITQNLKERYNYGLFIAIQDYQDNAIRDLDYPVQDSKSLMKVLNSKYTFNTERQTLLQNPTRAEIIQTFDKLAKIVTPQDNLLIFYAGHGLWDEQLRKGYWLPSNAHKENRSEWFSNSDLRDYIGGINSKHTLLIADACFSGGIFKTREAFSATNHTAVVELFKLPSRQAMTSGAMKSVPDKSVFLQYLLKRLNENEAQFLSSEELFTSFKVAVINNSPNGQVPQFGEIKETGDEGGDFIFIKR